MEIFHDPVFGYGRYLGAQTHSELHEQQLFLYFISLKFSSTIQFASLKLHKNLNINICTCSIRILNLPQSSKRQSEVLWALVLIQSFEFVTPSTSSNIELGRNCLIEGRNLRLLNFAKHQGSLLDYLYPNSDRLHRRQRVI